MAHCSEFNVAMTVGKSIGRYCFHFCRLYSHIEHLIMPLKIFLLQLNDRPHDEVCGNPIIKLPPPTLFWWQSIPEPHWEIAAAMKIANSDSIWRSEFNFFTKHLKVWGCSKGGLTSTTSVAEGISHSALEQKDPGSSWAQDNSSFFHTFSQTNPLLLLLLQ